MTSPGPCIRDVSPCPAAVSLWDAAADAHHAWAQESRVRHQIALWHAWQAALTEYEAHFETHVEEAQQPSFLGYAGPPPTAGAR
jgi:hypothetical protein